MRNSVLVNRTGFAFASKLARPAVYIGIVSLVCLFILNTSGLLNSLHIHFMTSERTQEKGFSSTHRDTRRTNHTAAVYLTRLVSSSLKHVRTGTAFSRRGATTIQLATVACGKKVTEALVMLKSAALLTTSSHLVFHVFAEERNHDRFFEEIGSWPRGVQERVRLRLYNLDLPDDPNIRGWTNPFFKPCSNHRLFLHSLLPDIDSVLYLDADTLVLTSLDYLWHTFRQLQSAHLVALAPESEDRNSGWYLIRSSIPYAYPTGLNSGVMLMNLTRLRHSDWTKIIVQYSQTYKPKLQLGDQDLINIYFHFHPGEYHSLDCSTNYRSDHCAERGRNKNSICQEAEDQGAYILHGNRDAFSDIQSLRVIFSAFREFKLDDDPSELLDKVNNRLRGIAEPCATAAQLFLKRLASFVQRIQSGSKTFNEV